MVTEFKIYRPMWGQGALIRDNGEMCCLGFLSKACGYSGKEMEGKSYPSIYWDKVPERFRGLSDAGADDALDDPGFIAAAINDKEDISQTEKETLLIELFSKYGITLSFYG